MRLYITLESVTLLPVLSCRADPPRIPQLFASFDPILAAEQLEAEVSAAHAASHKDVSDLKGTHKISVQPPTPWPVFVGVAFAVLLAAYIATRGLIEERISL